MGLTDNELVSPVSPNLRCVICTEIFTDPVFSGGNPCQHVFCRECILSALQQRGQCPVCRAGLTARRLKPNEMIKSLLDEVLVRCSAGCGWTGRQDARTAHMEACPKKLAPMLTEARRTLDERTQELQAERAECGRLRALLAQREGELAQGSRMLGFKDEELKQLKRCLDQSKGELASEAHKTSDLQRKVRRLTQDLAESAALERSLQFLLVAQHPQSENEVALRAAELRAQAAAEELDRATLAVGSARSRIEAEDQHLLAMQIFVKTSCNRTCTLTVSPIDPVSALMDMLREKLDDPLHRAYLVYAGKALEEGRAVSEYGISRHATLFMSERWPWTDQP